MRLCVLLCRDCCCGTLRKHPEIDHTTQESELRAAVTEVGGKLIRTRCLGVCERSNVVVVKTPGETYWFGEVLEPGQQQQVTDFVRGTAAAPLTLSFKQTARRSP